MRLHCDPPIDDPLWALWNPLEGKWLPALATETGSPIAILAFVDVAEAVKLAATLLQEQRKVVIPMPFGKI
jgi:hypothetical protein